MLCLSKKINKVIEIVIRLIIKPGKEKGVIPIWN